MATRGHHNPRGQAVLVVALLLSVRWITQKHKDRSMRMQLREVGSPALPITLAPPHGTAYAACVHTLEKPPKDSTAASAQQFAPWTAEWQQAKQGGGTPTRMLIDDSQWARGAYEALQTWRSTLFGRMADFYKRVEDVASRHGSRKIGRIEPPGLQRYDLFSPYLNCSGGNLTRLGAGADGDPTSAKLICMDAALRVPGCRIYSLGSRGSFEFESQMLQETPCEVHTFDCTFNGSSIHARHSYHQICLGRASREAGAKGPAIFSADSRFMAYSDITDMLNHSHVELLKIDIEGMSCFEFDVFSDLKPTCSLPLQVAMEVHFNGYPTTGDDEDWTFFWDRFRRAKQHKAHNWQNLLWPMHDVSMAELAVFCMHLADLGYGVVSREDNIPWGSDCCAEFTLVHVERLPWCG